METTSLTLSWFDILTKAITSDKPTEKYTKQFRKRKTLPTYFFWQSDSFLLLQPKEQQKKYLLKQRNPITTLLTKKYCEDLFSTRFIYCYWTKKRIAFMFPHKVKWFAGEKTSSDLSSI